MESDPNGIRTRVTAVKGRCPRPLDDRVGGAKYRDDVTACKLRFARQGAKKGGGTPLNAGPARAALPRH